MAAARLADELLQMILAPSLTISHQKLVSPSLEAFGENDTVSSASALLVCKRWLRVATPLLYEAVVIRSTAQCQALRDAFRQNLSFAKHVKTLRLEGSYTSLGHVLQPCTNLVTFVLLLNIYSDSNATALSRSLPLINPTEVILHDTWYRENAKTRTVLRALCDAIPMWTNLRSFQYPYGDRFMPGHPQTAAQRLDHLLDSLAKSASLATFHSPMSTYNASQLRKLALNSSVTAFKFYYSRHPDLNPDALKKTAQDMERQITLGKKHTPSSPHVLSIQYIELAPDYSTDHGLPWAGTSATSIKTFSPSTVPEHIWTEVVAFAALPDRPKSQEFSRKSEAYIVALANQTREALSLTCKTFERLVRPLFLSAPMILTLSSLERFSKLITKKPHLGRQVHELFFGLDRDCIPYATAPPLLLALLPQLTRLREFCCSEFVQLIPEIIGRLAEAAGDTLVDLIGFPTSNQPHIRALVFLHMSKQQDVCKPLQATAFPHLRTLRIYAQGCLWDTLCTLSLPALASLTLMLSPEDNSDGSVKFLESSGKHLEHLRLYGSADLPKVLGTTPELQILELISPNDCGYSLSELQESFSAPITHTNLRILTLGDSIYEPSDTDQNKMAELIFQRLNLAMCPSLKEIRFVGYRWPVEERAISRQLLPKKAVEVKNAYGIAITDCSGKPWRPRAQRRP